MRPNSVSLCGGRGFAKHLTSLVCVDVRFIPHDIMWSTRGQCMSGKSVTRKLYKRFFLLPEIEFRKPFRLIVCVEYSPCVIIIIIVYDNTPVGRFSIIFITATSKKPTGSIPSVGKIARLLWLAALLE